VPFYPWPCGGISLSAAFYGATSKLAVAFFARFASALFFAAALVVKFVDVLSQV
jgi:hypothetical protein